MHEVGNNLIFVFMKPCSYCDMNSMMVFGKTMMVFGETNSKQLSQCFASLAKAKKCFCNSAVRGMMAQCLKKTREKVYTQVLPLHDGVSFCKLPQLLPT